MTPAIQKTWEGGTWLVEPEHLSLFAQATGDDPQRYTGQNATAPPMFHVRSMKPLLFQVMQDPAWAEGFLRLLHASHDATFLAPLRPGDEVTCSGRLKSRVQKPGGLLICAELFADVAGTRAVRCESTFYIRHQVRPAPKPRPRTSRRPPDFQRPLRIPADASLRYAEASLDDNPLHVDPSTAQRAGFPDIVLQGLCTMAMTGVVVTHHAARGDSGRLRRLSARFSSPVHNGDALRVAGWDKGLGRWDLEVIGSGGEAVITAAMAQFDP